MQHIRFQAPALPSLAEAQAYWSASEDARWFSNGGPCHGLLVERLEEYLGRDLHVIPVSSATSGLLVALRSVAQPDAGRYVVVPSYTFAATAAIIHWAGFEPLFVDIDPVEWHADPTALVQALEAHEGKIASAVLCATYGTAPSRSVTDAWAEACSERGIGLVVDSAAGFGTRNEGGELLGDLGDLEIFSFHATKPFAIGEGGIVTTADAALADRVRRLCNFGFNAARVVEERIGLNAKMDELHAALALTVLDQFDSIVAQRQRHALVLRDALAQHGYQFQQGGESSAHQFLPMLCDSQAARDELISLAAARDIELRAYFADPLHRMPAFAEDARLGLPVTDDVASRVVCLPIYNSMDDEVLDRVVDVCRAAAVERAGR